MNLSLNDLSFNLAIIGVVFLILLQLYCTRIKDVALYIQDVILILFSVPLGLFLEMFFIQANLIHYSNPTRMLPPTWIILLYPLFALWLNHSLKKIKNHYFISFLFGFLCTPLIYILIQALGGLTLRGPLLQTWVMIGISLGLFFYLLAKIAKIIEKAATETLEDSHSKTPIKLLYDGECPLCKREIGILKKKDSQAKIHFIDISSKEFASLENNPIDYETAMSQIHAIDGKGNLLVGVSAFATVYACCQWLIFSTLLRIPFIKSFLKPLYAQFAKNRLVITGRIKPKTKK